MEVDVRSWALPLMLLVACGGPASEVPPLPVAHDLPAEPLIEAGPEEAPPSAAALAAARVQVEIIENLDAELRAVLSSEARRFKQCYAQALDRNPELTGSMTLDVRLTEGRPAERSAIQLDETGDWRLVACVEEAVRDWAVPGADEEELAFVLEFSKRAG
jgi:hypothetical protein